MRGSKMCEDISDECYWISHFDVLLLYSLQLFLAIVDEDVKE